jgi:hypothetical protein
MLILALEAQIELDVPLPPRRVDAREATLLTSLRVARQELDHALAALTCKPNSTHTIRSSRMAESTKTPANLLNAVSAADRARLEAMHSRIVALGAENHAIDATRELTGWFYELMKMPINGASPDPLADIKADRSLEIAIHRSTAKAIADVVHICAGARPMEPIAG